MLVVRGGLDVVLDGGGGAGVVDAGAHDSDTPTTPTLTGKEIADNGVPGGTFTVNDKCPPPTNDTEITHESAEADGIAATPSMANTAMNAIAAVRPRPVLLTGTQHLSLRTLHSSANDRMCEQRDWTDCTARYSPCQAANIESRWLVHNATTIVAGGTRTLNRCAVPQR